MNNLSSFEKFAAAIIQACFEDLPGARKLAPGFLNPVTNNLLCPLGLPFDQFDACRGDLGGMLLLQGNRFPLKVELRADRLFLF